MQVGLLRLQASTSDAHTRFAVAALQQLAADLASLSTSIQAHADATTDHGWELIDAAGAYVARMASAIYESPQMSREFAAKRLRQTMHLAGSKPAEHREAAQEHCWRILQELARCAANDVADEGERRCLIRASFIAERRAVEVAIY